MNAAQITTAALFFTQTCGGGSSSEPTTEGGWTCSEYQLMLDVELDYGSTCTIDEECTQVLDGTGCGCESADRVVRGDFDASWFYELKDEADGYECSIDFESACVCDAGLEPACISGRCGWQ